MKIKQLFSLLLICWLASCTNSTSINNVGDYDDLGQEIKKGNIDAYRKMKILCLDYGSREIIKWAKFAADTLKYEPANFDVLEAYLLSNGIYSDTIYLEAIGKEDKQDVLKYYKKVKLNNGEGTERITLIIN
jgi:hypothetical protein